MALDNEKLREFTRKVLECSQDGEDAHGADIHDWAVEAGLLIAHPITQPCDPDHCRCAEFGIFEDSVCFRMAPELQESPMRSDEGTANYPKGELHDAVLAEFGEARGVEHTDQYVTCWSRDADRGKMASEIVTLRNRIATLTAEVERVKESNTALQGMVQRSEESTGHVQTKLWDANDRIRALESQLATARADALKEVRDGVEALPVYKHTPPPTRGIVSTVRLDAVLALLDAKMRGDATAPTAPAASPSRPAGAPAAAGESHPAAHSPADG